MKAHPGRLNWLSPGHKGDRVKSHSFERAVQKQACQGQRDRVQGLRCVAYKMGPTGLKLPGLQEKSRQAQGSQLRNLHQLRLQNRCQKAQKSRCRYGRGGHTWGEGEAGARTNNRTGGQSTGDNAQSLRGTPAAARNLPPQPPQNKSSRHRPLPLDPHPDPEGP